MRIILVLEPNPNIGPNIYLSTNTPTPYLSP
ncbi:uncharacterized protein METZ01_LOCUS397646 [marine metagenome]|uniref:Uncharacterized protein n=1 Tax=marine metagenome TaxID=408172 RepID=A0A382VE11_9ZZZZ